MTLSPDNHNPRKRRFSDLCRMGLLLIPGLSLTLHAAPPVAVEDVRTISANTSVTLNPLNNDYHPDGLSFFLTGIGSPRNGTATINSTDGSVTYRPEANFVGTDTFSYSLMGESSGENNVAEGVIRIIVTDSRLPSDNPGNLGELSRVLDSVCARIRESSESEQGAALRDLLARCNALDNLAQADPDQLEQVLRQIAPEETLAKIRAAIDSNRGQTQAITQRIQQLHAGHQGITINGMYAGALGQSGGAAGSEDSIWSRIGLFASVQYDSAEKDQTQLENGYDYDANTLTFGMDYRLNVSQVIGIALGITRNDLVFSQQDGSLDSEVISFIVFGSHYRDGFSIDLQLGYAGTDFESWRHVNYMEGTNLVDVTLYGKTYGNQWLFNSQVQWEWHKDALTLYPFARLDYVRNDTKGYSEQGASGLAMTFGQQAAEQLTLAAGIQGTYAISRSWGVLIPTAQFTLLSDVHENFDPVTARFAYDPDPDNVFNLRSDGGESSYMQLGVGASAVFTRGISAYVNYQQLMGYSNLSAYQIQAGIRYEM